MAGRRNPCAAFTTLPVTARKQMLQDVGHQGHQPGHWRVLGGRWENRHFSGREISQRFDCAVEKRHLATGSRGGHRGQHKCCGLRHVENDSRKGAARPGRAWLTARSANNIAITGRGVIRRKRHVHAWTPSNSRCSEGADFDKKYTRQGEDFMNPKYGTADGPLVSHFTGPTQ